MSWAGSVGVVAWAFFAGVVSSADAVDVMSSADASRALLWAISVGVDVGLMLVLCFGLMLLVCCRGKGS